jgi:medium-chain acyl-[acyl-carrier-protein] hydrolase
MDRMDERAGNIPEKQQLMEKIEYEKSYKIPVYDIAFNGYLSPHSLFNYLQDIASEHAEILNFGKDDLMRENRFWVLSRIAVTVDRWPGWEETIIVKTWPRGTDKLFALRDFEVTGAGGTRIAAGSSSWLVVDKTSRRVQRPDSVLTHFNEEFPTTSALGRNASKLESAGSDAVPAASYRVLTGDLDINLHVNNVFYLRWVTDSYDIDFRMKHRPVSVEINYLAESRFGDKVTVMTSSDKNNPELYNHSVTRSVDSAELCRVQVQWATCAE